jgi:hypothetical protein
MCQKKGQTLGCWLKRRCCDPDAAQHSALGVAVALGEIDGEIRDEHGLGTFF